MSELNLTHSNGNQVKLTTPDTLSGDKTFKLPGADGSSGQFLKTDGSGGLSFGSVPAGAITSIRQIKQVRFTGEQSTTSSYADLSGLTITMTPTNATTQMLVIMSLATYHSAGNSQVAARIQGAGGYEVGDMWSPGSGVPGNINQFIMHDHNSTSAQTFTVQVKHESGSGGVNKDYNGTNNGICTLTVIEFDAGVIV
tara:strand:- start:800 stop:1390 length:591 start_codon:yes stop_codon:yes gene_type:complete